MGLRYVKDAVSKQTKEIRPNAEPRRLLSKSTLPFPLPKGVGGILTLAHFEKLLHSPENYPISLLK